MTLDDHRGLLHFMLTSSRRAAGRQSCWSVMLLATGVATLAGQARESATPAFVTVTAGSRYGAGFLHELLFGRHYRDLWTTPIRVEVLDLSTFGGGLTPLRRCSRCRETKSLHLAAADRRLYVFRSVDKDPAGAMPADLRETFVHSVLQDQISSAHPAGALVVSPLLEAAGVLHVETRLFVMPNDRRLDSFPEFKGMLGEFEERPLVDPEDSVGFAGAERIVSSQKLWQYLTRDSRHRVDSRAFLAARLMDVFVGDWDRHAGQWRWARFDEGKTHVWRPIPNDRDQAFSRLDGAVPRLAHFYFPDLVGFGDSYPNLVGLTWDGRTLDRRLLVDLDKAVWDSVAAGLQARLTDSVIDAAVRRLPPEYYARDGARLARAIKRRRDQLHAAANGFYALLARDVDVQATDAADSTVVDFRTDGSVSVQLLRRDAAGDAGGSAYYARTFHPRETGEVRVYLRGGDDRVVVRGAGAGGVKVRVITGGGKSELVDSSRGAPIAFYVAHTPARVQFGPHTSLDRHEFPRGPPDDPAQLQLRDWGSRWIPVLRGLYTPDLGVGLGLAATGTWYRFREDPYKTQITLGAAYAFGAQGVRADFSGDFRDVLLGLDAGLELRGSQIEVLRFYGFGNERAAPRADAYYKVSQAQYLAAPSLVARFSPAVRLAVGPVLKYSTTTLNPGSLIDSLRPYGVAHLLQYGPAAEFRIDTRDRPHAATSGVLLAFGGSWYPATTDVKFPFGEAHGEAATYLTARIPLEPTLALRVAGKKVWGSYPFQEAAYVGGATTVRGFPEHRFAGDAALYTNGELRLRLAKIFVLLPEDLGVFGLADAGRVYLAGESSDRWHAGVGGGMWISFVSRANTLSVAAAHSVEGTSIYVRAGFAF